MPVFTSIGVALGAAAASTAAFAIGVGATALVGFGAYSVGKAMGAEDAPASRSAIAPDPRISSEDTGEITVEEAQTQAKKRAFRSGILFTSPTGLGEGTKTSSAKLR